MRHSKDLGDRRHERIEYRRPGFIIPSPDTPWLECFILDVSASGICIEVGALAIPKVFGVAFNAHGTVIRVCYVAWRRGEAESKAGQDLLSDSPLPR